MVQNLPGHRRFYYSFIYWTEPKILIHNMTDYFSVQWELRGGGGSKLVSINPLWCTLLLASVLYLAPMDTITRRAKTFSTSLAHLTLSQHVGLVIFFSGQILICGFLLQRQLAFKNHYSWCWDIFWTNQPEAAFVFCKPMGTKLWW